MTETLQRPPMVPLPPEKVPGLMAVFESMTRESNLLDTGRSDAQHCMARLYTGYASKNMDVFVNDPDNIQHVIIFGRFPGIVTKEDLAVVLFLYSTPEHRGSEASREAFAAQIDAYCRFWPVDACLLSDWRYMGTSFGTGAFAKSIGFEPQEYTYVKRFTKGAAMLAPPPPPK